ncbi:hypothetical protein [Klebsiella aerogenes]|uniref:hypothetical protein n=1 Tax=Klebsiella aerogenes TaxID=548 RepID=UPI001BCB8BC1|nr:hypothetical protein [Klebsiella aerogenes]
MKVQVINNDGTQVWEFDAQKRNDFSGEWWNEPANHQLMAGIVGVLFQAYSQADTRPPGWEWPSSSSLVAENGARLGFLATANIVAQEGCHEAVPFEDN